MLESVLQAYGFETGTFSIDSVGTGLINHTWKVKRKNASFILQEINHSVFKDPEQIAKNISLIAGHLSGSAPGYNFIAPILSKGGDNMVILDGKYFRLFPFVAGSHTIDVVETPQQAFEAAAAFGKFTKLLSGFNASELGETLPGFHDLSNRYQQFIHALSYGNPDRIRDAKDTIDQVSRYAYIVNGYMDIRKDPSFRIRVTHHDTKISNVLFNDEDRALCIIDLDTVMPGYFISDVGDMMRTYLCPVSEEEKDLHKIEIRDDFYHAIVHGYASEMDNELTASEKKHFLFAGQFMIYMQALRFLNDHLKNDVYYGAKYPGHNLMRARNQLVLLDKLSQKKYLNDLSLSN